jgi:glutamate synthase (NADPH/NADH) small chain
VTSSLLRFTTLPQQQPDKRPADARRHDFAEISAPFQADKACDQSGRCSQCGIPFCQTGCPLQNNIPDWLMLTAEGRLEEAYAVSSATNTFPEICGRICPQDRLCEGSCVIEKGFEAVTIGAVEKYITDTAWNNGWVRPIRPRRERPQSVGIIGAGPAGLAAAERLRMRGYQVDVYDRHDRMGGLLMYGIPNFKLDKQVVERRIAWLADGGIRFHPGTDITTQTFAELHARHDALLIATGVYQARGLKAPGVGLDGIIPALDFLIASNRSGFGTALPEGLNAHGKRVVVVGGGDTAMDCVRTAIRQEAASVTCLYRRDRENMPGSRREVLSAEEEGVVFQWLSAPEAFMGATAVEAIRVRGMALGPADATGRREVQPTAAHAVCEADMVIKALGFDPEPLPRLFGVSGLQVTEHGTLKVDRHYQTSLPGVFAAGDIVRGASLVVWAIREGRDAAAGIIRQLEGAGLPQSAESSKISCQYGEEKAHVAG